MQSVSRFIDYYAYLCDIIINKNSLGEGTESGGWGIVAKGSSGNRYNEDEEKATCVWDIGEVSSFHSFFQNPSVKTYSVEGEITITLSKQ